MADPQFQCFRKPLFGFLDELANNNNRDWFQENKRRYESEVLAPAQHFIREFAGELKKISPLLVANDRRVGGSLMRVYRDTRFSKNKTPYRTNVGIQFRHELGKDVHAPGLYLHLSPDECFLGAGMWKPDTMSLTRIRDCIVDDPSKWKRIRDGKRFGQHFALSGDQLKTAPRGFAKSHPCINDLRRTSFIGVKPLRRKDVLARTFFFNTTEAFGASRPLMRFLCEAIGIPFGS